MQLCSVTRPNDQIIHLQRKRCRCHSTNSHGSDIGVLIEIARARYTSMRNGLNYSNAKCFVLVTKHGLRLLKLRLEL